jgi:hypothetical protein
MFGVTKLSRCLVWLSLVTFGHGKFPKMVVTLSCDRCHVSVENVVLSVAGCCAMSSVYVALV